MYPEENIFYSQQEVDKLLTALFESGKLSQCEPLPYDMTPTKIKLYGVPVRRDYERGVESSMSINNAPVDAVPHIEVVDKRNLEQVIKERYNDFNRAESFEAFRHRIINSHVSEAKDFLPASVKVNWLSDKK